MVSEALWDAGGEVEGEWEGVFEVEGGGWVVSTYYLEEYGECYWDGTLN